MITILVIPVPHLGPATRRFVLRRLRGAFVPGRDYRIRATGTGPCRAVGESARNRPLLCSPMALYAAYGSNMDPAHMLQRCPSSPVAGTGWLPGWRLTFGGEDLSWDGALATVVED